MAKKIVKQTCLMCNRTYEIEMDVDAYKKWIAGSNIQDVAPELSIDERELLISGVCGNCFDELFQDEEE